MAVTDLDVLQTVRLKGRLSVADLAALLGSDEAATVDRLMADGLLVSGSSTRLTPDGRARLADLLAAERSSVDAAAAESAYQSFTPVNADFKAALSRWQLGRAERRGEGLGRAERREDGLERAADGDADSAETLAAVEDVHRRVTPVVAAAGALVPRLNRYAERLSAALRKAQDGDLAWLSRPLVDSYHTVWFELHEELIGLAGRTREGD